MIAIDDATTAEVQASPTPVAPPLVCKPLRQEINAIINNHDITFWVFRVLVLVINLIPFEIMIDH